MPDQGIYRQNKFLKRKSVVQQVIMVGCIAWAVSSTWGKWQAESITDTTANSYEQRIESLQQQVSNKQETIEIQQQQAREVNTLLRTEQAIGGDYQAKYIKWMQLAKSAQGSYGYWKKTAMERQDRICHLEQLARDNGVKLYSNPECSK